MARSAEQNRTARERAMESILAAAIDLFSERGMHAASIAEIARRAGVAQGLVNYHFGGKEQLAGAVIDRWYETLFGIARTQGSADARLRAIIDAALTAAAHAQPLQRAVLAMQQQPSAAPLFAEAIARHADTVAEAEESVRDIFRERGAADPALEEVMLRTTLEGIAGKYAVFGEAYPLSAAHRWVLHAYGLEGDPST